MNRSKTICQRFIRRLKKVCFFPGALLLARRRQGERDKLEAERLDRIRNPSKYRGK